MGDLCDKYLNNNKTNVGLLIYKYRIANATNNK